jgi:Arc/MetJ family transcription regulator
MASNLALDDNLLNEAMRVGGFKTKKETVTVALQELLRRKKAMELIDLFGSVEIDDDYDHKTMRAAR